jgi:hypothetical protein
LTSIWEVLLKRPMQNAHTTALHAAKRRLCCHKQSLDPERVTEVGFRTPGILREVWRLPSDAVTVTLLLCCQIETRYRLHAACDVTRPKSEVLRQERPRGAGCAPMSSSMGSPVNRLGPFTQSPQRPIMCTEQPGTGPLEPPRYSDWQATVRFHSRRFSRQGPP